MANSEHHDGEAKRKQKQAVAAAAHKASPSSARPKVTPPKAAAKPGKAPLPPHMAAAAKAPLPPHLAALRGAPLPPHLAAARAMQEARATAQAQSTATKSSPVVRPVQGPPAPKPVTSGAAVTTSNPSVKSGQLSPGTTAAGSVKPPKPSVWGSFKSFVGNSVKTVQQTAGGIGQKVGNYIANPKDLLKDAKQTLQAGAKFTQQKWGQFKTWAGTPEGKAALVKGLVLTGVAVLSVASAGTLTAPALLLAGGISAAGGVAAEVAGNATYMKAAQQEVKRDPKYKVDTKRTLFSGVSAKSIATDAAIGAFGGPLLKFGGNLAAKGAVGLAKMVPGVARGTAYLAGAPIQAAYRRLIPGAIRSGLGTLGRGLGDVANSIKGAPGRALGGVRGVAADAKTALQARARAWAMRHPVQATRLDALKGLPGALKAGIKNNAFVKSLGRSKVQANRWDRRQLFNFNTMLKENPVARGLSKANKWAGDKWDGARGWALKRVNAASNKLGDFTERASEKFQNGSLWKSVAQSNKDRAARWDQILAQHPDSYLAKSISNFRGVGAEAKAHFGEVWQTESAALKKSMGALFGKSGRLQADFKTHAGGLPKYAAQKSAALREIKAVEQERIVKQELRAGGYPDTPAARRMVTADVNTRMGEVQDKLVQKAERQVAQNPSPALRRQAMRAMEKAERGKNMTEMFGAGYKKQGLFERTGSFLAQPVRKSVTERAEKVRGLVNEVRTKGLWTGGAMLGMNAAAEGASDHWQKQAKSKIKNLVIPPDPKAKPKEDETLQGSMLDKVKEEAGLAPVSDLWKSPVLEPWGKILEEGTK